MIEPDGSVDKENFASRKEGEHEGSGDTHAERAPEEAVMDVLVLETTVGHKFYMPIREGSRVAVWDGLVEILKGITSTRLEELREEAKRAQGF